MVFAGDATGWMSRGTQTPTAWTKTWRSVMHGVTVIMLSMLSIMTNRLIDF